MMGRGQVRFAYAASHFIHQLSITDMNIPNYNRSGIMVVDFLKRMIKTSHVFHALNIM